MIADFKQRLIASAIFIAFAFFCLYFAFHLWFQPFFVAAVASIASLALWEFYQIAISKDIQVPVKLGLTGCIAYFCAIYFSILFPKAYILPYVVLWGLLVAIFLAHFSEVKEALIRIAVTFLGIAYIAIPLSLMVGITYFYPPDASQDGRWWLLYLLATAKMADVGGLFVGRFFGKHKLAKSLSPKKTIEGAAGGLIFSIGASLIFSILSQNTSLIAIQLPISSAIWMGALISLLAQAGDLAESLLKRDGGVKDSNTHLPGLGGMLDIVDSLLFTSPIVYFFLVVFGER